MKKISTSNTNYNLEIKVFSQPQLSSDSACLFPTFHLSLDTLVNKIHMVPLSLSTWSNKTRVASYTEHFKLCN